MNFERRLFGAALLTAGFALAAPRAAQACGGCFAPSETQQVVTDHRMVMAIHPTESILWDQIRYTGAPEEFSWVLPVFGDVRIEVAAGEFFDEIDQQTAVRVQAPVVNNSCGGGGGGLGCGASSYASRGGLYPEAADDGVTVINQAVVGPYETVTLRSDDAGGLQRWLDANHYSVPPSIAPVIEWYTTRHMDFVALKLRPGVGVQAMQPIRIRYASPTMVLPLRMVAAGVGDKVGITLWVFGAGRYEAANFTNGEILASDVVWDWDTNTSNYRTVFSETIARLGGRAWITEGASLNSGVPQSTASGADWQLAMGTTASIWTTRLRTDLLAGNLDQDLVLRAAATDRPVSSTLQLTRTTGTSPAARCSAVVTIATPSDFTHRPAQTLVALVAGVIALAVGKRRARRK